MGGRVTWEAGRSVRCVSNMWHGLEGIRASSVVGPMMCRLVKGMVHDWTSNM